VNFCQNFKRNFLTKNQEVCLRSQKKKIESKFKEIVNWMIRMESEMTNWNCHIFLKLDGSWRGHFSFRGCWIVIDGVNF
jgi:hypothetical protein